MTEARSTGELWQQTKSKAAESTCAAYPVAEMVVERELGSDSSDLRGALS